MVGIGTLDGVGLKEDLTFLANDECEAEGVFLLGAEWDHQLDELKPGARLKLKVAQLQVEPEVA